MEEFLEVLPLIPVFPQIMVTVDYTSGLPSESHLFRQQNTKFFLLSHQYWKFNLRSPSPLSWTWTSSNARRSYFCFISYSTTLLFMAFWWKAFGKFNGLQELCWSNNVMLLFSNGGIFFPNFLLFIV